MVNDPAHEGIVGNESDNFHLAAAGWTNQRVRLVDLKEEAL